MLRAVYGLVLREYAVTPVNRDHSAFDPGPTTIGGQRIGPPGLRHLSEGRLTAPRAHVIMVAVRPPWQKSGAGQASR